MEEMYQAALNLLRIVEHYDTDGTPEEKQMATGIILEHRLPPADMREVEHTCSDGSPDGGDGTDCPNCGEARWVPGPVNCHCGASSENKGSCAPCKHAVHSDGCIVLTGNLSGGCHQ